VTVHEYIQAMDGGEAPSSEAIERQRQRQIEVIKDLRRELTEADRRDLPPPPRRTRPTE
jgi:hypothetical protein